MSNSNIEQAEQTFLVVNREAAYLKKSALSYAKSHNLELALLRMYERDSGVASRRHGFGSAHHERAKRNRKRISKSPRMARRIANIENLWKNLQKEPIFNFPIERSNFWLSSPFGPRKKPDGKWQFHKGIDMAAPKGTPVKAAGDGTVLEATYVSGYGNTILLAHDNRFKTRYAHLDKIFVHVGQKIKKGDYIGKVGATGSVRKRRGGDGSHLHFEVYAHGRHINPFYFLA